MVLFLLYLLQNTTRQLIIHNWPSIISAITKINNSNTQICELFFRIRHLGSRLQYFKIMLVICYLFKTSFANTACDMVTKESWWDSFKQCQSTLRQQLLRNISASFYYCETIFWHHTLTTTSPYSDNLLWHPNATPYCDKNYYTLLWHATVTLLHPKVTP